MQNNEPSLTSMRQMVLEISHFEVRNLRMMDGVTLFFQLKIGQLFFGQLNLANYLMQIRLDLEGLKI